MITPLWNALARGLRARQQATVLDDLAGRSLSADELLLLTETTARWLAAQGATTVALSEEDAWITNILQLSAWRAGLSVLVLPGFFSPEQRAHALESAAPELLFCADIDLPPDAEQSFSPWTSGSSRATTTVELNRWLVPSSGRQPHWWVRQERSAPDHAGAVITFTSGSTGRPKGVRLGQPALLEVARSLSDVMGTSSSERHLSLLPPAVLLETVGGLIRTLLKGGLVMTPERRSLGVADMITVDGRELLNAIDAHEASSIITMPQVLTTMVESLERDQRPAPPRLGFVGVGGAAIAPALLRRAEQRGLPVCEGYGLSECASVVCLNVPGATRLGSVGRPLPHARVVLSSEGEVLVGGALEITAGELWPTGDLGHFDDDGFLFLRGRMDNRFCTAFGRNISPEWIEAHLALVPGLAQLVVLGEGQPAPVALVVSAQDDTRALLQDLEDAARSLPAYARPGRWLLIEEPFSPSNGLWTANGRPRRHAIAAAFAERLTQEPRQTLHPERSS